MTDSIDWCLVSLSVPGFLRQVTPWASCKDYLNDMLWGYFNKRVCTCPYPLKMGHKHVRPDMRRLRIGTIIANGRVGAEASLKVIHAIEKRFGFEQACKLRRLELVLSKGVAQTIKPEIKENMFLFEADKKWAMAAPMASLFMTVLRGCITYNESYGDPIEFFAQAKNLSNSSDRINVGRAAQQGRLKSLLRYGPKNFFETPEDNYKYLCQTCGTYEGNCVNCGLQSYRSHSFGMMTWSVLKDTELEKQLLNGKEIVKKRSSLAKKAEETPGW